MPGDAQIKQFINEEVKPFIRTNAPQMVKDIELLRSLVGLNGSEVKKEAEEYVQSLLDEILAQERAAKKAAEQIKKEEADKKKALAKERAARAKAKKAKEKKLKEREEYLEKKREADKKASEEANK
jgi:hypothetical protein